MHNSSSQTFSKLIRHSILQATIFAVLAVFLLSIIYGLVDHYQQKRQHIQQLAALLTNSASTVDGASLAAKQVSILLDEEPSIQSILFYSTTHPIDDLDQATIDHTAHDWQNALFASTVSFNYAVTSPDIGFRRDGNTAQDINSNQLATILSSGTAQSTTMGNHLADNLNTPNTSNASDTLGNNSSLIGYINITLDINKLRLNWFQSNLLLWFSIFALCVVWVLSVLRKLNGPAKDMAALVQVCDMVIDDPELNQLPVLQQRLESQELIQIRQAFVTLFDRLQEAKQDYQALAVFEQQLYNKDLSLNVQHHNFQSMITHELKTSLNAIVGGLQLLDNQFLNAEQQDTLAIVHKGSQQLMLTLEQIIQLNKIEKGQVSINLSEFDPLQLIADLLAEYEPIAKQKGLELTSHIHHIDYILEGDVAKIQQILSILLDNAIKFTCSGQVIINSQLTHFNESNRWQISVKDAGIGIDANHLDDIFNPFFQVDSSQTREYEGTGIGLPVVKQMAQLIGAAIEVDSTPGIGSQFTVIIPLRNQYQARQQYVLAGLVIIYYYSHEIDFLVEQLQRLGATVTCQQHEQVVIEQMNTIKVDMVMFAEDVLPDQAASLARRIREYEAVNGSPHDISAHDSAHHTNYCMDHRALLIDWYPKHQTSYVDIFEHDLKAAGIDYCHSVIQDDKILSEQLKNWLA